MPLKKRLLKNPLAQRALSFLLALFIRLVYRTSRRTHDYHPQAGPFMRGEENAIFAFWHGRMMMCPTVCPPGRQMRVLISHHRDGKLISDTIGHFNQKTVSGSSSKGGQAAVNEILRALEAGDNISITPDGPRGPAQVAAGGIASIARLSGKKILPVTFSASRARRMKSWDRFMLALPFSRIVFCVGAPIAVAADANEETSRMEIERAMNALTARADEAASV